MWLPSAFNLQSSPPVLRPQQQNNQDAASWPTCDFLMSRNHGMCFSAAFDPECVPQGHPVCSSSQGEDQWRGSLEGKLWQLEPRHSLLFVTCFSPCLTQGDLVAVGVLSGNRNFEGRVHPNTRANYLASPPLVIAYAIAGTIRIDFEKEPLGKILFGGVTVFPMYLKTLLGESYCFP